jgi:hypothetical protein
LCRAIAHAVSRRLAKQRPGFEPGVRSCAICGGQSDTGVGFLRVLRLSLPLIPPTAAHSSSSINRGWCNRPSSGLRAKWTQSHPKRKKRKNTILQNKSVENAVFVCFAHFYLLPNTTLRILRIKSQQPIKNTPWSESVSELYQPSDRHLSAKLLPTFADRGCRVCSATDPYGRILGFLDLSRRFFFQLAPQLYSRGGVDPVPDPLLLRKSGSAGNRTRTSGSVARNWDH